MVLALLLAASLSASAPDAGTPEPHAACRVALERGVSALEKLPSSRRLAASLELLGRACPRELEGLANAASQASRLRRSERAKLLAQAAAAAPHCTTELPAAAAGALLRLCPPAKLELAEEVAQVLDSGTYLFVVAVSRRLDAAGAFGTAAERVLSILVLNAALEGEAAR